MTYGNNRASGITRFLFLLFFTQLIMRYFLANCAPKIPNYANCAIFPKRNLCFNLLSLQIFFGFTFIQNYPVFCRQIHRSRALFSFPSCDWLYLFSNHGACYIKTKNKKKPEHSSQRPAAQPFPNASLICDICQRFLQRGGGCWRGKCTVFTERNSIHLSRYEKKHSFLIDLSNVSKILRHYAFFSGIMRFRMRA